MNIVFLVIDTLRYDYIRAHGANDWIQTPNLDRLAAESLIFDRAYAASYPTIPHRTDVITGEYAWPYYGPFHPWMPLRFDVPTLPRLLAHAGYATQLIHDTPHMVNGGHAFDWPFAAWSFVRGAEVDRPWIDDQVTAPLDGWAPDPLFDFVDEAASSGGMNRLLLTYARANRRRQGLEDWNAVQLFDKGAQFLRDNASRGRDGRDGFFLWLDCFDPHEPWDVPPDFVKFYDETPGYDGQIDPRSFSAHARRPEGGVFPKGVKERLTAYYAAKVSWVDHNFGKILATLAETGLDKTTAVVVTADHGTNLGERGGFGKTWTVNEQEGHVPLLVHLPGGATGRSDAIVQPQDISATLLAIAGVDQPARWVGDDLVDLVASGSASPREVAIAGQGVNAWEHDPDRTLFSVFGQDWYMNVAANPEACRLFQYGSVEDVSGAQPGVVASLREAALDELVRRGTHPALVAWVRSEGQALFPDHHTQWPGPAGWRTYWSRVYDRELKV